MIPNPSPARPAAPFHTTRWTRVCLAKEDSEDGRIALAELCEAYYDPVVAYLRAVLRDGDAAREVGHAFFESMLRGGTIRAADPDRGRFRHYLLGAVKHFLAHRREAAMRLKRGGGVGPLSLDACSTQGPAIQVPEEARLSPEAHFDRQWAVTVLARAMDALERHYREEGKAVLFARLRPIIAGEACHGELATAALDLGMSEAAVKAAAHRLRQRFRRCVKAEVGGTLADPAAVEEEMRSLFTALGG